MDDKWFQQDETLASLQTKPGRVIIDWPPKSYDLTPLDFFLSEPAMISEQIEDIRRDLWENFIENFVKIGVLVDIIFHIQLLRMY